MCRLEEKKDTFLEADIKMFKSWFRRWIEMSHLLFPTAKYISTFCVIMLFFLSHS